MRGEPPSEFSKSKLMVFPRSVLVGHDVLGRVGEVAGELGLLGPALVLTGPRTRKIAGDRVAQALASSGFKSDVLEEERAAMQTVGRVEGHVKRVGARLLVGVGGGSIIDVAKVVASRAEVPFLSVPTTASHDGIASPRASVEDDRGKSSLAAAAPLAIIADTGVIAKAPYRFTASGCADVLSNITAVLDWKLANRLRGEEYSSFAASLAQTAADLVLSNADEIRPNLEEAVWLVVKSLIVSGVSMSVAASSRPASGAEHMFSHALDRLAPKPALHGEQCGVGAIMTMYLHGGDWEGLRDALAHIGAPTDAKGLGIPRETIIEALLHAHENKPDRYTILGDRGLSQDAAEALVKATGVA